LNSILSGRADACLIDRAIVYGFVDDNPSTTVATEFQTGELYGFAAAKSDAGAALIALVNQVLTTSNSDGTYLNLYKKWIDANATSAKLP
ncbi:MAG: transporter substrate-binding domain-containing protein, partial [Propionibacteriaceae bacterium]|nr:transporter substrate-binding domain-containing protein [Propionibacteriaceae bacterium]